MPLFRIVVGVFVLVVAAAVLSLVFNVLKALLIVGAVGVAIGIALGFRARNRRPADETRSLSAKPPRR